MSSYLSSILGAFGGRGGGAKGDSDDSDFEDAVQLKDRSAAVLNAANTGTGTGSGSGKAGAKASSGGKAGGKGGGPEEPSVHWLTVETTETDAKVVCERAAAEQVLLKVGEAVPLNLISIFGAARQGKSFLMNMLAGEDRLFKISNSKDPCTQGVDLSRKVLTWSQFHHLDDLAKGERRSLSKASSEPRPHVAFVDVEGQGDRDVTYDANLVCPVVLASKCVLFNWKDSLQKDKLLNLLAVMQRAAFNVASEEEGGLGDQQQQHRVFGHLHILFRDWHYEGDVDSVRSTLFTPERSNAPDALARNQIRSVIEASFESISIWLLPPPVDKTALLSKELVASDLSDEFKAQVRRLRHALAEQCKAPHHFAAKVLTGPKIASLVPQVVATLNSGEQVLPKSAYAALIEAEVTRVQATYLKRLQRTLLEVKRGAEAVPVTTADLRTRLLKEVHTLQRDFDRWLRTLGDEAAAAEAAAAFHEHCAKGSEEVIGFNRAHLLAKHVAAAGRESKALFDAQFTNDVEARLPMAPERLLASHTRALQAAEAHVRSVVVGEPDAEALLGEDALPALRTHAELAKAKAEQANEAQLQGVHERERGAFAKAKAGFEAAFFGKLAALKAKGGSISEDAFVGAYDAALATARAALRDGLHPELTGAGRREELEAFLEAAAASCKSEQGCLYQLACTQELVAEALRASGLLVRGVQEASTSSSSDAAALKQAFASCKAGASEAVEGALGRLAVTDEAKAACREAWGQVTDEAWALLQAGHAARRAALAGAAAEEAERVKKEMEGKVAEQEAAARAREKETAARLQAVEEGQGKLKAAYEAKVKALEQENARLAAELAAARAKQQAAAEQAQAAKKQAAAAEATAATESKKRKAAEEAAAEAESAAAAAAAAPPAKSRKVAAAAAAAAEMEVENEEEEEQVAVKEEAAASPAPAPKPAAKGRAKKGAAATAATTAAAAASKAKSKAATLEQAREEERKRIEESTAKRITRARK